MKNDLRKFNVSDITDPKIYKFICETPLDQLIYIKITCFLDQIDSLSITNLHSKIVSQVERPLFHLVLKTLNNNQLHASKVLGINRNTLRNKIKALALFQESLPRRLKKIPRRNSKV